jgi:hypothetical protein
MVWVLTVILFDSVYVFFIENLTIVLRGYETWFLTLREEHRLRGVCEWGAVEDIWA